MTRNITDRKSGAIGQMAESPQPRWYYCTSNGRQGHVWAASDDDAANQVVRLTQRSPYVLRRAA